MRRLHLLDNLNASIYTDFGRTELDPRAFNNLIDLSNRMETIYNTDLTSVLSPEDLATLQAVLDQGIESSNETPVTDSESTNEPISAEAVAEPEAEPEVEPLDPVIPVNSETILREEFTSRFNSAIWYDSVKSAKVMLAGCGGIGSYIGFLLSRLQINRLIIYDPDIIESVNMSGQMYPIDKIGEHKVTALSEMMRTFSNFYRVSAYSERYTSNSTNYPIMICGFDNMEARKTFFYRWLDYVRNYPDPSKCLYIDGRLAAEEFQILAIQGNDQRAIKEYESKWLFDDSEAEETVCSYKQTTFMANMIGSMIVNIFVNFMANHSDPAPIIPRDIPFFISYSADTMYTKIEM